MGIGERIKSKRKEKRMTQVELGTAVNVSSQVISNWERGYTDPSHSDVARLSEVFECSTEYLHGKSFNDSPNLLSIYEKDIAKRIEELKQDIEKGQELTFDGEPMSEEAKESFLEAMEFIYNQTKKINKRKK